MFRELDWTYNLRHGVIAGLLFSACVLLYILDTRYAASWLLYVGSFMFFVMIVVDLLAFNRRRGKNANTVKMVFSSHVTTIIGILVACVVSFLLLSLLIPGYLDSGPAGRVSPDTPINAIHDKTRGLSFRVFIGATIINFSFGSFAGIIYPFTIKRNQTKESGEPYPLHNKG